jgi:hypothetical protein
MATKTEQPAQRLARQEAEEQAFLREQDQIDGRLHDIDKEQRTASEQDDTDKVLALGKDRDKLHDRLKDLRQLIEAKQVAIQTSRKQITEAQRAEQVKLVKAHVATVTDIAKPFEETAGDFFDYAKRYVGQLLAARQALVLMGSGSVHSCPLPATHDLAAWIVDQLLGAGFPIAVTCRDSYGNPIAVNGRGIPPIELAEIAASIAETTR